ncbi:MAG: exonuclease SbcCD subunit D [Candidatus Wukongarchaeota archaeon]|nr:exonuclease SbcCD subunit D [Candidatus Wukongarchaeota archaeon]
MNSIKFAHISDFHLGYCQYGLAKRFTDIGNAARISIEKALERNVDFILFTGDLFHCHSPSSGTLRQAIKILEMPKKASIPFYVIRGNHDASYARSERYGGDVLDFLSDLRYLQYIKDSYIDHDPLRIWGVGYYGIRAKKRLLEVLENRKKEDGEERLEILALHALIEGQMPFHEIDLYTLANLSFNYIALGHYHNRWELAKHNLYCPGATEHMDTREWKSSRGFYFVEVKNSKFNTEFIEIPVRLKKDIKVDLGTVDLNEAQRKMEAIIKENDIKDSMLRFEFTGHLAQGKKEQISTAELLSLVRQAFYVVEIRNSLESKTMPIKAADPQEAIKKLLLKLLGKTNEEEILPESELVQVLLRVLGEEGDIESSLKIIDDFFQKKENIKLKVQQIPEKVEISKAFKEKEALKSHPSEKNPNITKKSAKKRVLNDFFTD